MRLAWFVSPHGFGHAARACALVEALREAVPALAPNFFTTVPRWFFEESLGSPCALSDCDCDVGLVQPHPTREDLPATLARLERLWAGVAEGGLAALASDLRAARCAAVVCDIAPLGLAAARAAGLPSILVENFTWDWIYEGYLAEEPRFAPWIERLGALFAGADLRIQCEPVCRPHPGARAPLTVADWPAPEELLDGAGMAPAPHCATVAPVARRPRANAAAVRARLGLGAERPLVVVSLGGIETRHENLDRWRDAEAIDFVVPGGTQRSDGALERRGNLVLLPHRTPIYHPDLVRAADAVVGKLGYSTLAEALAAGTRYAYLPRPGFRESEVLARWVRGRLPALALDPREFAAGAWVDRLPDLLALPRPAPGDGHGARAAARAIARFLGR